jgi:O-antigen/teichoic acid export membrane protein
MDSTFRQILRHTTVFSVGAILSRLASILLLPLYMRYLHTADYGVIAIVDLTVGLLGIAGSAGIAAAAMREHFRSDDPDHVSRVWWTAFATVALIATAVVAPPLAATKALAGVAFGGTLEQGSYYFALALPTLWVGILTNLLETYFRAEKSSTLLVGINLGRLLLNVALNVTFLVWFEMGVAAVLWGNLLTGLATCVAELAVFCRQRGRIQVDWSLVWPFWRYGWPLMLFGLLSMLMHEADRYILSAFSNLEQVGLYSVAYQIGQGANAMIIMPFMTIWSALVFEVARQPERELVYARVFKHFAIGLALLLLLASFCAGPILQLVAPPEYAAARDIVPIVCLAYLFFSIHEQFRVPALITNRTVAMLPVVSLAVVVNLGLNLLLITPFGAAGAAWASVGTFVVFSGAGLLRYRQLERYPYPLVRVGIAVGGMVVTYAIYDAFAARIDSVAVEMLIAGILWLAWVGAMFGRVLRELIATGSWRVFVYSAPLRDANTVGSAPPVESARAAVGLSDP